MCSTNVVFLFFIWCFIELASLQLLRPCWHHHSDRTTNQLLNLCRTQPKPARSAADTSGPSSLNINIFISLWLPSPFFLKNEITLKREFTSVWCMYPHCPNHTHTLSPPHTNACAHTYTPLHHFFHFNLGSACQTTCLCTVPGGTRGAVHRPR